MHYILPIMIIKFPFLKSDTDFAVEKKKHSESTIQNRLIDIKWPTILPYQNSSVAYRSKRVIYTAIPKTVLPIDIKGPFILPYQNQSYSLSI